MYTSSIFDRELEEMLDQEIRRRGTRRPRRSGRSRRPANRRRSRPTRARAGKPIGRIKVPKKASRPGTRRPGRPKPKPVAVKLPKSKHRRKRRHRYPRYRRRPVVLPPRDAFPYERAIRRNLRFARVLGWNRHRARLHRHLSLAVSQRINRTFVRAVRRWQRRYHLRSSGVIGPRSWRLLRRQLGISRSPAPSDGPARLLFFKDDPELKDFTLAPTRLLTGTSEAAQLYNRIGGLLEELSDRTNVDTAAVLAVWLVESRGRRHRSGRTPGRFENHLFYNSWGRRHDITYRKHFRHGGYAGTPGKAWQNHQFREKVNDTFARVHASSEHEYRAYHLARRLATPRQAMAAFRLGEPHLLPTQYAVLGYSSAQKMFDAFQTSLRAQLLGFFDYCLQHQAPAAGDLLVYLRNRDWDKWIKYYNPDRKASAVASQLRRTYGQARKALSDQTPKTELEILLGHVR